LSSAPFLLHPPPPDIRSNQPSKISQQPQPTINRNQYSKRYLRSQQQSQISQTDPSQSRRTSSPQAKHKPTPLSVSNLYHLKFTLSAKSTDLRPSSCH
jgi:hypothetical protein